jgi:hypothetical protein
MSLESNRAATYPKLRSDVGRAVAADVISSRSEI